MMYTVTEKIRENHGYSHIVLFSTFPLNVNVCKMFVKTEMSLEKKQQEKK